jgi:predicted Zn-dependent peptidase
VADRIELNNGLRIATETVPGSRSVSIGVLIDAGPQDDPADKWGLAHFTEHAFFQGTSSRDAVAISRLMDVAGGQMGAFTGRDYTCFYANVLSDYCPYALDLLGDILLNSTFPEDNLEREKQAILHELDNACDNPYDRIHQRLKELMWPDSGLGRSILGTRDSVQGFTREDVIYFAHNHYLPDRVILAASGNLNHDHFVAQTQDAFWRMLGTSIPRCPVATKSQGGVVLERASVSQAYFAIGIPTGNYTDENRYLLHLLNCLLGGGMSSRLFYSLREERGLVYHIQSEIHAYRDAGLLVMEGSTTPEQLIQVLSLILVELSRLASFDAPVDAEELWKAKMQIRGQHLLASECLHTRMSRMLTQEHYFGHRIADEDILDSIDAIDFHALREYASESLLPSLANLGVAVIGPTALPLSTRLEIEELIQQFQLVPV